MTINSDTKFLIVGLGLIGGSYCLGLRKQGYRVSAIARLKPGETIEKFIYGGYATLSLGYIGIYEATMLTKHCSHTTAEGRKFAMRIMDDPSLKFRPAT